MEIFLYLLGWGAGFLTGIGATLRHFQNKKDKENQVVNKTTVKDLYPDKK